MSITYRRDASGDFYITASGTEQVTERFEVAVWYRVLSLDNGEYRLLGVDRYGKPRSNEDVVRYKALIPATIVDSYFPSLFGGCQKYSEEQRGRDRAETGNPYQYVFSIDAEWLYEQVALPDELAAARDEIALSWEHYKSLHAAITGHIQERRYAEAEGLRRTSEDCGHMILGMIRVCAAIYGAHASQQITDHAGIPQDALDFMQSRGEHGVLIIGL